MSTSQSTWLQDEVDRYRTAMGGQQTGPNRIDLDGKGEVFVALPGEAHPRTFDRANPTATYPECTGGTQLGYFCAYSGTWGTGSQIRMYSCGVTWQIPWVGNGSWGNNQTGHAVAISSTTGEFPATPARHLRTAKCTTGLR